MGNRLLTWSAMDVQRYNIWVYDEDLATLLRMLG